MVNGPGVLSMPITEPKTWATNGSSKKELETTNGEKNKRQTMYPAFPKILQNIPYGTNAVNAH